MRYHKLYIYYFQLQWRKPKCSVENHHYQKKYKDMKVKIEKNCVQADQKDHEMEQQNHMERIEFSWLCRVIHAKKISWPKSESTCCTSRNEGEIICSNDWLTNMYKSITLQVIMIAPSFKSNVGPKQVKVGFWADQNERFKSSHAPMK